jgi:microcystin-dependent protein
MADGLIVRRGKYVIPPLVVDPGLIVEWFGLSTTVPEGWALCDGANGTPDLRNRFIIGAGDTHAIGATGGSADAIVPSHNHSGSTNTFGHSHGMALESGGGSIPRSLLRGTGGSSLGMGTSGDGSHSHTVSITSTGTSGTNANLPPYLSLFYIIKEEE